MIPTKAKIHREINVLKMKSHDDRHDNYPDNRRNTDESVRDETHRKYPIHPGTSRRLFSGRSDEEYNRRELYGVGMGESKRI